MRGAHARAPIRVTAIVAVCAGVLAGCSTSDESDVPLSCRATAGAVQQALHDAPEEVTLEGTPISDCFAPGSEQGDLQSLGFALTEAAADLSSQARERPNGRAAMELGYLVGAVRAGAAETGGIHDELVRRIEQELSGVDTTSEVFMSGERAGRESG